MAVYYSDTMSMAKLSFPEPAKEPEQFFSAVALTILFREWTANPRVNMGVQMIRQGISITPSGATPRWWPPARTNP